LARTVVDCEIRDEVLLDEDTGHEAPGVVAICGKCDLEAQCFGQGGRSVRRALMLLRENCEEGCQHFYKTNDPRSEEE
jgi:hypothetical protein